jgi:hypothetical protein
MGYASAVGADVVTVPSGPPSCHRCPRIAGFPPEVSVTSSPSLTCQAVAGFIRLRSAMTRCR